MSRLFSLQTSLGLLLVAAAAWGPPAPAFAQDAAADAAVEHDEPAAGPAEGEQVSGDHEDEAGGNPLLSFDFGSAFWNLIIFLVVLVILSKFVWPGVLGGLQAREDKIRNDLQSAEQANAKAEALLSEYQAKLDDASQQVQTMLADARRDAEANGARIVEEAKQEADRQRQRAIADIETAKKVAMADIADQTAAMAIQVARQVVGRELNQEDHADLIRQSLERLPSH